MSKLEHLIFSDGERYPMLVDDEGVPHFWITLFITTHVRPNAGRNTMVGYIGAIRHFFLWEEIKGRNVLSEFQKRKFLDNTDAISIRDFCLLQTDEIRRWRRKADVKKVRRALDDFPSVPRNLERVKGKAARTRFARIVEYLTFVAMVMLRQRPNVEEINKQVSEMRDTLLANKPNGGGGRRFVYDPNDKAPPPKIFDAFIEAVQFNSPKNPYRHKLSRRRNQVMFNILNETGMRAGELLALRQPEDIDWNENLICVVRRHDDPEDPRPQQPVQKTRERNIPVSPELIREIRSYIMNERAQTPNADRHPFIFVTHHKGESLGNPLSNSGFNRMLETAVKKISNTADTYYEEDLFNEIRRHGFRHNFNYRLSQIFDENNKKAKTDPDIDHLNTKQQNQIRMYLNGWADEKTAETYNRRFVVEKSNQLMREDMEAQSNIIRNSKK